MVGSRTIITRPPNRVAADIHHRMPAIVDPSNVYRWIGVAESPIDLLTPYAAKDERARLWF